MSSSCVPTSATRPSSRTTMKSAAATVDVRWAMSTVVRSRMKSRRRERIAPPRCVSTGGGQPALADDRIEATGELRQVVHQLRGRHGEVELGGRGVLAGEGDVLAQALGEEEGLLRHDGDEVAQVSEG